jgi:hypothetical protein
MSKIVEYDNGDYADDCIPADKIVFDFCPFEEINELNAVCAMDIKPGCKFIDLSNPVKKTIPVPEGEVYICNYCCNKIENGLTTCIEWTDKHKDIYCLGCYDKMLDNILEDWKKEEQYMKLKTDN